MEPARDRENWIGRTLQGRWRVLRLVGRGGMASVYEAEDDENRRAAVKLLHPRFASDARVIKRFLREAKLANALEHPGVVTIDHVGMEGPLPFLVMELLHGRSFNTLLRGQGPLRPLRALELIDQVLDVIAHAHERGILHRDLTPSNLYLDDSGMVRVLDFGVGSLPASMHTTMRTSAGSLLGTPAYMSPEQARADWRRVDARSDLWSVGASLFTLLSGALVHQGRTANEILGLAMTRSAPSLAVVAPDLPHSIVDFVDKALAFDPADRWQSAREMQSALRHLRSEWGNAEIPRGATSVDEETLLSGPITTPAPVVTEPQSRRGRQRRAYLVPVLGVVIMASWALGQGVSRVGSGRPVPSSAAASSPGSGSGTRRAATSRRVKTTTPHEEDRARVATPLPPTTQERVDGGSGAALQNAQGETLGSDSLDIDGGMQQTTTRESRSSSGPTVSSIIAHSARPDELPPDPLDLRH